MEGSCGIGTWCAHVSGKKTFFYNGEELMLGERWYEEESYLVYNKEERQSWEVVIVLPGVEVIPGSTFRVCKKHKTVIMADTVRRIENGAFGDCYSLVFVRFSRRNLEVIGLGAFNNCYYLNSVFIPPSCRDIAHWAFKWCRDLIIFHIPRHTQLGASVIVNTAIVKVSPFSQVDRNGWYEQELSNEINTWIKNINQAEIYALHRECTSFYTSEDAIYETIKRQGLASFHVENEIGITASQYLQENPHTDITEQKLINRLVLDLMGEIITYFLLK